jgi:tetratricopeptide (TPR) repeat protein
LNYNLFDIFGGNNDQQQSAQTTGTQEQIERARTRLEEEPNDPSSYTRLGALYLQNGQTDEAIKVLERGREKAPKNETIPLYLGQAYEIRAQGLSEGRERNEAYRKAAEAYVASTETPEGRREAQAYLLAGRAYEQAGDAGRAIQYYNGYLDREPRGEQADAARAQIESLLSGGSTAGGGAGGAGSGGGE